MEGAVLAAAAAFVIVVLLVIVYLSVRVVQQYEQMVVFRLGKTNEASVRGPGIQFLIPVADRPVKVDTRVADRERAEVQARVDAVVKEARQSVADIAEIMDSHSDALDRLGKVSDDGLADRTADGVPPPAAGKTAKSDSWPAGQPVFAVMFTRT